MTRTGQLGNVGRRTPLPPHPRCTHKQYAMTCDEFESLLAAAQNACQMCSQPSARLVIDHDHGQGIWAVRGLLCAGCNWTLGRIENGRARATKAAGTYLSTPWHQGQGWGASREQRLRRKAKCGSCRRDVGLMLNGALYPHRPVPSWNGPDCPGSRRQPPAG